ncbi:outer membrane beta-barrel protein [Bergeyella sp. RCAD1439]|uniref:outer membrane beta-barrel protein n=1 Tax=Bergeyella anatis TaxID=3113737 RepID=UPI002E1876C4|nr:outer membrane beta-barrel protein [Bergeyella sp. RCAD1439]
MSNLTIGNASSASFSGSSYYVGALAEYPISNHWSVQGELLYSPVRGSEEVRYQSPLVHRLKKTTFQLNHLMIPLAAKYQVLNHLSLAGGFNLGVILSAKADVYTENDAAKDTKSLNLSKNFNTFNFPPL